jgi:hypothetical protein
MAGIQIPWHYDYQDQSSMQPTGHIEVMGLGLGRGIVNNQNSWLRIVTHAMDMVADKYTQHTYTHPS